MAFMKNLLFKLITFFENMPVFELKSQREINEDYQGVTISEFAFLKSEDFIERELIDYFIHSTSFTEESRSERIKNYTGDIGFLRQAFEIELLKINDFKQTDKDGVSKFLNDYAEEDWGDTDGNDFVNIKNKFIEFLSDVDSNSFYIISKEWFDENDKLLREPENWCYMYYFLIIWLDEKNKTLTVSEWKYD